MGEVYACDNCGQPTGESWDALPPGGRIVCVRCGHVSERCTQCGEVAATTSMTRRAGKGVCPPCVSGKGARRDASASKNDRRAPRDPNARPHLHLAAIFGSILLVAAAAGLTLAYSRHRVRSPANSPAVAETIVIVKPAGPVSGDRTSVNPPPSLLYASAATTLPAAAPAHPATQIVQPRPEPEPVITPATQPLAPRTRPIVKKADSAPDELMARGKAALAAGDHATAAQVFREVLKSDPDNAQAVHGFGLTYALRGDNRQAIAILERALALESSRALVHNLAVVLIRSNSPIRAARFIRTYLTLPATPADEPLQNVLGAALSAASSEDRAGYAFTDLREFYFRYDTRLASERKDGKRRWGMDWLPAAEADTKWALSKHRVDEYDRLSREAARASDLAARENSDLLEARSRRAQDSERINELEKKVLKAQSEKAETAAKAAAAKEALKTTEMPRFPRKLELISIDAVEVSSPDDSLVR